MQLYLTRCALSNGTTKVVQEVVSTCESEGAFDMARRWLPELIDGCDGEVRLSTEFRAPFERPGRNIHSTMELPVHREIAAVHWNITEGDWPAVGQTGMHLLLRAVDGTELTSIPMSDGSAALQLAHAYLHDAVADAADQRAWARTTPHTVEVFGAQGLVMRARIELEVTYRVEDAF